MPPRARPRPKLAVALLGVALLGPACLDWGKLENGACGDGFLGREEACDDGNRISGDGCSDSCTIEPAACGNGRLEPHEECDDGNNLDDDACIDCKDATCGDHHLWDGQEQCDDGNRTAGDGCSPTCQLEMVAAGNDCHNGKLDAGEPCDDGNESDNDSCLTGCSWATCGDGRLRTGVEECDDSSPSCISCMSCGNDPSSYLRKATSHCYTLHAEPTTEQQARTVCQNEGGDLWTLTSDAETSDVAGKLALSGRYWLGFLTSTTGSSTWVTGEGTGRTSFAAGEPSNPALHCVAFDTSSGGAWFSEACPTKQPFVCERSRPFLYDLDHHAYKLHTGGLSSAAARQHCAGEGGHLAALETDAERQFVGKNVGLVVWLDASDAAAEGQFVWSTGGAVDQAAFAVGQPDDTNATQQCLVMNQGDKFADAACSELHAYVCEFD